MTTLLVMVRQLECVVEITSGVLDFLVLGLFFGRESYSDDSFRLVDRIQRSSEAKYLLGSREIAIRITHLGRERHQGCARAAVLLVL